MIYRILKDKQVKFYTYDKNCLPSPEIIKEMKKLGYVFDTVDDTIKPKKEGTKKCSKK